MVNKSIFKSLCNFFVALKRTGVASKFQSNLEVFCKVLEMSMQGSCHDFCSKFRQVDTVTVVSGFENTIYKKTTRELTKAGSWKLVSLFFHDTIEGNEGILGGGVEAYAWDEAGKHNPTARNMVAML